jgi:molecular chaperone DnaJ
MQNYFEILGVTASASPDEVKSAYRKRALETHPDCGGSDAAFKQVAEAYEAISSGKAYKTKHPTSKPTSTPATPKEPKVKAKPKGVKCNKIFNIFLNKNENNQYTKKLINLDINIPCNVCGGNINYNKIDCDNCNGRGHSTKDNPFRTNDERGPEYDELYWGTCRTCNGTGHKKELMICKKCGGERFKTIQDKFMITIPPNTSTINIPNYWSIGNDLIIKVYLK